MRRKQFQIKNTAQYTVYYVNYVTMLLCNIQEKFLNFLGFWIKVSDSKTWFTCKCPVLPKNTKELSFVTLTLNVL